MKWYHYLVVPLLFVASDVLGRSQLVERELRWRSVPGARSYLLQVRNQQTTIINDEVQEAHTQLLLPIGRYEARVSAIDRFGRAESWSEWLAFHVRPPEDIDANEAQDPFVLWRAFVPGLVQYDRGDNWHAGVIVAGLAVTTAYGISERTTGDRISYQAEDLSIVYVLGASGFVSADLLALNVLERGTLRNAYDRAQSNQRVAGYAFLAIYLYQLVDAIWFSKGGTIDEEEGVQSERIGWSIHRETRMLPNRSLDDRTEAALTLSLW